MFMKSRLMVSNMLDYAERWSRVHTLKLDFPNQVDPVSELGPRKIPIKMIPQNLPRGFHILLDLVLDVNASDANQLSPIRIAQS